MRGRLSAAARAVMTGTGMAVALNLSGCALLASPHGVPLAGGGDWPLLTPAQLNAPGTATQAVEAHFGGRVFTFLFYLEATTEQLVLVSTSPDGTELFSLRQSAQGIEQKNAPFLPRQMNPKAVLADMQMAFASDTVVQANLANTDFSLFSLMPTQDVNGPTQDANHYSRVIAKAGKPVISVRCETADCWHSVVHFENHAWNYSYVISPVEVSR